MLEAVSRGLLGVIGIWMLWQAFRRVGHQHGQGVAAGFVAGLIPCPLTLFVMTFAITRGVTLAGVAFAFVMIGVAVILDGSSPCGAAPEATVPNAFGTAQLGRWYARTV